MTREFYYLNRPYKIAKSNFHNNQKKFVTLTGQDPDKYNEMRVILKMLSEAGCTRVSTGSPKLGANKWARKWCDEKFGDNWLREHGDYYFNNEHDADEFVYAMFAFGWMNNEDCCLVGDRHYHCY